MIFIAFRSRITDGHFLARILQTYLYKHSSDSRKSNIRQISESNRPKTGGGFQKMVLKVSWIIFIKCLFAKNMR